MEKYRLQIWYSGRVQGVGFRYKARSVASGYDVSGSVRNLDDGRVHLVAIGEKSEVRAYADKLAEVMADFIREVQEREDFGNFSAKGFEIEAC